MGGAWIIASSAVFGIRREVGTIVAAELLIGRADIFAFTLFAFLISFTKFVTFSAMSDMIIGIDTAIAAFDLIWRADLDTRAFCTFFMGFTGVITFSTMLRIFLQIYAVIPTGLFAIFAANLAFGIAADLIAWAIVIAFAAVFAIGVDIDALIATLRFVLWTGLFANTFYTTLADIACSTTCPAVSFVCLQIDAQIFAILLVWLTNQHTCSGFFVACLSSWTGFAAWFSSTRAPLDHNKTKDNYQANISAYYHNSILYASRIRASTTVPPRP